MFQLILPSCCLHLLYLACLLSISEVHDLERIPFHHFSLLEIFLVAHEKEVNMEQILKVKYLS